MNRFPPHYKPLPERPDKRMDDEFEHENSMKTKDAEQLELDEFCANHVMGLKRTATLDSLVLGQFFIHRAEGVLVATEQKNRIKTFSPTTNTADAMQVLEKCLAFEECTIEITTVPDKNFRIRRSDKSREQHLEFSETLPLAICKFAKKLFSK